MSFFKKGLTLKELDAKIQEIQNEILDVLEALKSIGNTVDSVDAKEIENLNQLVNHFSNSRFLTPEEQVRLKKLANCLIDLHKFWDSAIFRIKLIEEVVKNREILLVSEKRQNLEEFVTQALSVLEALEEAEKEGSQIAKMVEHSQLQGNLRTGDPEAIETMNRIQELDKMLKNSDFLIRNSIKQFKILKSLFG